VTPTPARLKSTYAVVLMLLALLLFVVTLVFGPWAQGYGGKNYVVEGGVDATNGTIRVDDVWVDAPAGVRMGAQASLQVQLTNDSGHSDALLGVSTPMVTHVQLKLHDKPVRRLLLKPWTARNLEWHSDGAGIELVGWQRPLKTGQWFPVTFRFQHSSPITVQITAGPLAHGGRSR
jgi:copper(I)-binding protein